MEYSILIRKRMRQRQGAAMPSTNSHMCAHCLQPLIRIKLTKYYCLACDNYHCYLFREIQGYIPREDEPQEKPKELPSAHIFRPGYKEYNERGRENYHFARSLKIPSKIAAKLRNKSKKEIERVAKELVGV